MNESSLSINNKYNKVEVYKNDYAKAILITRLLLMNKGENIYHPDMGVGIISKRFSLIDGTYELENEINEQVKQYLPELIGNKVEIEERDQCLFFSINIDNKSFIFKYEDNNLLLSDIVNN